MQDDRSPLPWPVLVLLVLVVGGWVGWFFLGRIKVYVVTNLARVEVDSLAHVVQPPVAGVVIENQLALGQPVIKGDVLLVLDSTPERLQLAQENARLRAQRTTAEALQRESKAERDALAAQMQAVGAASRVAVVRGQAARLLSEQAAKEDKIVQELRSNSLATGLEALKSGAEARRQQTEALAASLEASEVAAKGQTELKDRSVRLARLDYEVASLEVEMELAAATVARLEHEIERRTLRAAVSGLIADLSPVPSGSTVAVGQKVAVIVPEGGSRVVARLQPSEAVGRVHTGQTAVVRLDAFPWTEYGVLRARVSQVAHEPQEGSIRTELAIDTDRLTLPLTHGLTGSAEIELEEVAPYRLLLRAAGQMMTAPAAPAPKETSPPSAGLP